MRVPFSKAGPGRHPSGERSFQSGFDELLKKLESASGRCAGQATEVAAAEEWWRA